MATTLNSVIGKAHTGLHRTGNRQQTAREHRLSSDTADRQGRVIITMVNGNGQVTDLDEAVEDMCGGNN